MLDTQRLHSWKLNGNWFSKFSNLFLRLHLWGSRVFLLTYRTSEGNLHVFVFRRAYFEWFDFLNGFISEGALWSEKKHDIAATFLMERTPMQEQPSRQWLNLGLNWIYQEILYPDMNTHTQSLTLKQLLLEVGRRILSYWVSVTFQGRTVVKLWGGTLLCYYVLLHTMNL